MAKYFFAVPCRVMFLYKLSEKKFSGIDCTI